MFSLFVTSRSTIGVTLINQAGMARYMSGVWDLEYVSRMLEDIPCDLTASRRDSYV